MVGALCRIKGLQGILCYVGNDGGKQENIRLQMREGAYPSWESRNSVSITREALEPLFVLGEVSITGGALLDS